MWQHWVNAEKLTWYMVKMFTVNTEKRQRRKRQTTDRESSARDDLEAVLSEPRVVTREAEALEHLWPQRVEHWHQCGRALHLLRKLGDTRRCVFELAVHLSI